MTARQTFPTLPRLWTLCALLLLAPLLSGFTGKTGQEMEFTVGVGLGQIDSAFDSDRYGEIGGAVRYKFRNFPYDDLAGWLQFGGSWTTYPTGGNYGNQIVSLQFMGGVRKNFGEFGGGFVLSGDVTDTGPMILFPCFRMLLGKREVAMFGFGVLDEVPLYAISNAMHMEAIIAIPTKVAVKPWVKVGTRLNLYVPEERFPLEFFGGLELEIKRHFKLMIDGSVGDGGSQGEAPTSASFSAAFRLGGAFGPGVTSDREPRPAGF